MEEAKWYVLHTYSGYEDLVKKSIEQMVEVALRDLEIRGAGNLLGAEQHGYIDSIGYDLYVKLLSEAVLEERGEAKERKAEAQVDMKISAHIPESYIPTSAGRMEMYKKISLITSPEDERDIYDEFLDRYGNPPRAVERLLEVALMRVLAEKCEISRIEERDGSLIFTVGRPNLAVWSEVFSGYHGMRFSPQGDKVIYKFRGDEPSSVGVKIMRDYHKAYVEQQT